MKRKHIAICVACAIVLCGILVAHKAWNAIHGEQDIVGPVGAIPEQTAILSPPIQGPADWPCWRGLNGDGKSAVTGIRKDWPNGLKKLWEVDHLCQGKQTATWSAPAVRGNRLVVPGRSNNRFR